MKALKLFPLFFILAICSYGQGFYNTATASGTDTYTATVTPTFTAYYSGQKFTIKFTNANTGASTININSKGAVSLVKQGSTALSSGDIKAGQILFLQYDGSNMQVIGDGGGSGGGGGSTDWGDIGGTLSDQTDLQTALDAKQATITASNGLTKTSNTVTLGGTVTASTDLRLSAPTGLSISMSSRSNAASVTVNNGVSSAVQGYVTLSAPNLSLVLDPDNNLTGTHPTPFYITGSHNLSYDAVRTFTGDREIVDKGYIDDELALKADDADLDSHTANTSNPHSVTKTQVGLGNVDNTSDANKPVSTATQTALNGKWPLGGSGELTDDVLITGNTTFGLGLGEEFNSLAFFNLWVEGASTISINDDMTFGGLGFLKYDATRASSGYVGTTIPAWENVKEYADAKVADAINNGTTSIAPSQNAVFDALALKANLASPALTGTPTAPTAAEGTNTTQIATTAFVTTAVAAGGGGSPSRTLLHKNNVASSVTGTTSETIMDSFLVPAGTIDANDRLYVVVNISKSGTAGTYSIRGKFNTSASLTGATTFMNNGANGTLLWNAVERAVIFTNSISSQIVFNTGINGNTDLGGSTSAKTTLSQDFSADQYIMISLQPANAGDAITLESWYVELID